MGKLCRLEAMFHTMRDEQREEKGNKFKGNLSRRDEEIKSPLESLTYQHYKLSLSHYKKGLDVLGSRKANRYWSQVTHIFLCFRES